MSSATRAYIFAQSINELFVQPWRRFSRKAEGCRRDPNLVKNVDIAPHADFRSKQAGILPLLSSGRPFGSVPRAAPHFFPPILAAPRTFALHLRNISPNRVVSPTPT